MRGPQELRHSVHNEYRFSKSKGRLPASAKSGKPTLSASGFSKDTNSCSKIRTKSADLIENKIPRLLRSLNRVDDVDVDRLFADIRGEVRSDVPIETARQQLLCLWQIIAEIARVVYIAGSELPCVA